MASTRTPALRALCQTLRNHSRQDTLWRPLPFLHPCAVRSINTTAPFVETDAMPDDLLITPPQQEITPSHRAVRRFQHNKPRSLEKKAFSPRYSLDRTPSAPAPSQIPTTTTAAEPSPGAVPIKISPSVLQNLPYLTSQPPYYINIHIHGRPYLVTAGDTLRLPFLMHGVLPGDVLRLDRASALGSRDWTLKAGLKPLSSDASLDTPTLSPSSTTPISDQQSLEEQDEPIIEPIIGNTDGLDLTPKTIYPPNRKPRFRQAYLDDRLFVCRAVVLGTESEPMRVKEKTKRRQRRVKKVESKHRFTVMKISEVSVKSMEDVEAVVREEVVV